MFTGLPIAVLFFISTIVLAENPRLTDYEYEYLKKYNYLEPLEHNEVLANLNGNKGIGEAICKLQRFFNLEVTCEMNEETRVLMKKERCGVPDVLIKSKTADYKLHGSSWDKTHLTWKVTKYTSQVTATELHNVIEYSLNVWAKVSTLTFEYREYGDVDLEIGFYSGSHLNERADLSFDGFGGVLAHAYFPLYGGDIHIDSGDKWGITKLRNDNSTKSLAVVLVHELGHALGLNHEPDVIDSIMRPVYSGWSTTVTLSSDDIAAIRRLYGTENKKPQPPFNDFCTNPSVDAIFEHNRNSYYLFKGSKVRYIPLQGEMKTWNISSIFRGTLRSDIKVDATLNVPASFRWTYINRRWRYRQMESSLVYIFQGYKVHSFRVSGITFVQTSEDYIYNKFKGIPGYIDSAFIWSGNNRIYFTKNDHYYRVSQYDSYFSRDYYYPRSLSIWNGLPNRLDASLYMSSYGVTVFFAGGLYYLFNDNSFRVSDNFPSSIGTDWYGCTENGELDERRKLGSGLEIAIEYITNNASVLPDDRLPNAPSDGSKPTTLKHIYLTEPNENIIQTRLPYISGANCVNKSFILSIILVLGVYFS